MVEVCGLDPAYRTSAHPMSLTLLTEQGDANRDEHGAENQEDMSGR